MLKQNKVVSNVEASTKKRFEEVIIEMSEEL